MFCLHKNGFAYTILLIVKHVVVVAAVVAVVAAVAAVVIVVVVVVGDKGGFKHDEQHDGTGLLRERTVVWVHQ